MLRWGFTGTQAGMTLGQQKALRALLAKHRPDEFHHGDCVGADAQAAAIAQRLGIRTICHPTNVPGKRAYTKGNAETRPVLPPMERNHFIVAETDVLVAAPKSAKEVLRSGTWATIRYARKQRRPIYLIAPEGAVTCSSVALAS